MAKLPDYVGPFRLARFIRSGNATQIWEAIKEDGSGRYVLKILRSQNWGDRKETGFLKHEFEVAHAVEHPNIIRIFEFANDGKIAYLVLELFTDLNMKQFMREKGTEPIQLNFAKVVNQCVGALHSLHERGWVHCDIKPDNFLMNEEAQIKLIDFTISQKITRGKLAAIFRRKKAQIQGTRSYMSPEQIRGEPLDGRSDIYSLGCMFYEFLAGKVPYTGTSPNDLLNNHLRAPIPSVQVHNENVTEALNSVLNSMMAKDAADRPASMMDVMKQLRSVRLFKRAPAPKEAADPAPEERK